MRSLILSLFFFQTLFIFSQKEIIIVKDSLFTVCYPVLEINEKSFLNEIGFIVLEYNVNEKYKERIFIIQTQRDTVDNSISIIVNLESLNAMSILDLLSPLGVINIQNTPFVYYGDIADIESRTSNIMNFTRKKRIGYTYDNVFRRNYANISESPTWHFLYKDGKVKLLEFECFN